MFRSRSSARRGLGSKAWTLPPGSHEVGQQQGVVAVVRAEIERDLPRPDVAPDEVGDPVLPVAFEHQVRDEAGVAEVDIHLVSAEHAAERGVGIHRDRHAAGAHGAFRRDAAVERAELRGGDEIQSAKVHGGAGGHLRATTRRLAAPGHRDRFDADCRAGSQPRARARGREPVRARACRCGRARLHGRNAAPRARRRHSRRDPARRARHRRRQAPRPGHRLGAGGGGIRRGACTTRAARRRRRPRRTRSAPRPPRRGAARRSGAGGGGRGAAARRGGGARRRSACWSTTPAPSSATSGTTPRAESWDRHLEPNLRAPFVLTQGFARALPAGAEGVVVNMLDQRVWSLTPHFLSYTPVQGGAVGLDAAIRAGAGARASA